MGSPAQDNETSAGTPIPAAEPAATPAPATEAPAAEPAAPAADAPAS